MTHTYEPWRYVGLGGRGGFTLVSVSDLPRIDGLHLMARVTGEGRADSQARAHVGFTAADGREVQLHRYLLDAPAGLLVDHVNGNGLDNRRENLRLATAADNARNSSMPSGKSSTFRGVTRHAKGRWQATIGVNGVSRYLGLYDTELDAALAYDKAALALHGEFARTNVLVAEVAS